ncbi:hypothetical protein PG991_006378 [Apiospora marii]|uniref:PH domain-containing protein n=1 Tax=Apiospora marii TaxID=335849 RepID=A0ABR1SE61_9PEZI
MVSSPAGLGVWVAHNQYRDQRVHIDFRTRAQADAYLDRISRPSIVRTENLALERAGPTEVSLRLPFRVSKIVASTTCRGFYLVFTDTELARDWVASLLIWKTVPGQERWVYVDRFISDRGLARLLDRAPNRGPAGGFAQVSIHNRVLFRMRH